MENDCDTVPNPKKFYFLEYIYIFLKSVQMSSDESIAFGLFKEMKHEHRLGESKYKKISIDTNSLSEAQLNRYHYTFHQVTAECREYELVTMKRKDIILTENGQEIIELYDHGKHQDFYEKLFFFMEAKHEVFRTLIRFLYNANEHVKGLIVFPSYSPRKLSFEKSDIRRVSDYLEYLHRLREQLEHDVKKYLGRNADLSEAGVELLKRLNKGDKPLMPKDNTASFPSESYNRITKRVRDYWISHFLKDIYKFDITYSAFEIWLYRAKQIGILNVTDFYPNFNGRIVYPTSVIDRSKESSAFKLIYSYDNEDKLFIHKPPSDDGSLNRFVEFLLNNYYYLKNISNNYFVKLTSIRELLCYNMKISEMTFQSFLNEVYRKALSGELKKIKISLEVDKLPEDTKSMYLKRTPVMVDGQYRNIIAIDIR